MNMSHQIIRDCTPNFATPAVQIPANPSQIQISQPNTVKAVGKRLNSGLNSRFFLHRLGNVLGEPLQVVALKTKVC
jgi:hypothetical protein